MDYNPTQDEIAAFLIFGGLFGHAPAPTPKINHLPFEYKRFYDLRVYDPVTGALDNFATFCNHSGFYGRSEERKAKKGTPVAWAPRPFKGRNEPCPCGSGVKWKRCCMNKPKEVERENLTEMQAA